MLKIGFMTTLGVNVGDEFIREGIRAVLERAGIRYSPLYVSKHDIKTLREPREDEMLVVADKFWDSDVFIQSGAPVYWRLHNGVHTSLNSEWSEWLWRDRILCGNRKGPLFLNLGAGSCQPWGEGAGTFLGDSACAEFARQAGRRAALTSVRDPVAADILTALKIQHEPLPCPAFLAGARHRISAQAQGIIGVNLMPLGGHYDLQGNFPRERWTENCRRMCEMLRSLGHIVFIAHDQAEHTFMTSFALPSERVAHSGNWREYLDLYAGCTVLAANRVHGAVCAAGFGVPSLIMGNDTRARIGEYIGLQVTSAEEMSANDIAERMSEMLRTRNEQHCRLLAKRDATMERYLAAVTPILASIQ